jgi:hypothetical protein
MQIVKTFSRALLVFLAISLMWTAQTAAQEQTNTLNGSSRVTYPGTQVSLNLPGVFVFDEGQSVFVYSGASATLVIRVLATTPFETMEKTVTETMLEKQQMVVGSTEDLRTDAGRKARLFTARLQVQASEEDKKVDYKRLIFITGDEQKSVWITVNYPVLTEKLLDEPMRAALLSVEF